MALPALSMPAAKYLRKRKASGTRLLQTEFYRFTINDKLQNTHAKTYMHIVERFVIGPSHSTHTPNSPTRRSSGRGWPVAGSRSRSRCAAIETSSGSGGPRSWTCIFQKFQGLTECRIKNIVSHFKEDIYVDTG